MANNDGGPLAGKIKKDYSEEATENRPVTDDMLTSVNSSNPTFIRFSVKRNPTREEIAAGKTSKIEIANWGVRFPTRDAADSHAQDIRSMMRNLRGEPEQAWSEIARASKCPNPQLLAAFRTIDMDLVEDNRNVQEPVPAHDPRFQFQRPDNRHVGTDTVTGKPHQRSSSAPAGSTPEAGSGPDGKRSKKVRAGVPKGTGRVQSKRGSGKASKGKAKQGAPRKGNKG